jgi:hypothetical protein
MELRVLPQSIPPRLLAACCWPEMENLCRKHADLEAVRLQEGDN